MRKLEAFRVPKFLSLEHAILEVVEAAAKANRHAVSSSTVINMINEKNFLTILDKQENVSSGAIFGTLSRLKGKNLLIKVMITESGREVLAYQLTENGQRLLKAIRENANNAIERLQQYQPTFA